MDEANKWNFSQSDQGDIRRKEAIEADAAAREAEADAQIQIAEAAHGWVKAVAYSTAAVIIAAIVGYVKLNGAVIP